MKKLFQKLKPAPQNQTQYHIIMIKKPVFYPLSKKLQYKSYPMNHKILHGLNPFPNKRAMMALYRSTG